MRDKKGIVELWREVPAGSQLWDGLSVRGRGEDSCAGIYWEYLGLSGTPSTRICLASLEPEDLPEPEKPLSGLGKYLTGKSMMANLMARRPGQEDITFYSLCNQPTRSSTCRFPLASFWEKFLDRKMLAIAQAISWRRHQLVADWSNVIERFLISSEPAFQVLDIGCGSGFDSLEMVRRFGELKRLRPDLKIPELHIVNLDINGRWLEVHEKLRKILFPDQALPIEVENTGIFEYVDQQKYREQLKPELPLLILCNGFGEFFGDEDLQKLFASIFQISESVQGSVDLIMPFSLRNPKQERIAKKLGFNYLARERETLFDMLRKNFPNFTRISAEAYHQIALVLHRDPV